MVARDREVKQVDLRDSDSCNFHRENFFEYIFCSIENNLHLWATKIKYKIKACMYEEKKNYYFLMKNDLSKQVALINISVILIIRTFTFLQTSIGRFEKIIFLYMYIFNI